MYRNKARKERYRNLEAFTHNIDDGKITKISIQKDQIFEEIYNENYTVVKFTFPQVQPGSVLTYKYQIESPFIFNFNGWDFQNSLPKMYSEYVSDLPGNYQYNIGLVGTLKLETNKSSIIKNCLEVGRGGASDCVHNIYVMKDIPAFKTEKYMTAKKNYFSRIKYELKVFKGFDGSVKKYSETWKNVDRQLQKERTIGLQLKKVKSTKDIFPDSLQVLPNTLSKAKKLYTYFTENYVWNNKYEIFRYGDIQNVLKTKTGNVAGINILLHNALKQQGFEVNSILLSTRENGYATKNYPILTDFNYIIVQISINGKKYLLDGTEKTLTFGEIPYRCLNQYGRLLDFKNGSSWVDLKPTQRSLHFFKEEIKLDKELNLMGDAKYTYLGYPGFYKRKKIDQIGKDAFIEQIKSRNVDLSIHDLKLNNKKNSDKPFEEEFSFNRLAEEIDGLIYVRPFTKPFFKENPFKLTERSFPVDFGFKDTYTYYISLEIPDNYNFIDTPKNSYYSIPNNLGKVGVSYNQKGQQLLITYRINFNSSYYPTEYYPILKKFFELVVNIENNTFITISKES
ncbi:hypothetical protein ACJRPK_12400 [Aquimarina sp. 2-A2]|uniref:hypothetical protein n=1 Tax=Aquimarina sp. 2-A2 TaxID=3382644 RepID=UPI00387F2057